LGKHYHIPFVGFTSNGQLLKQDHIEEFIQYGLDELTLSVHGVTKETYEHFMVNASFDTFHQVLRMVDEQKKNHGSSLPALRLNFTVNNDNVEELMRFFDVYGQYHINTLQVRPVGAWGGVYNQFLEQEVVEQYKRVVDFLSNECHRRGITFLFRHDDTSGQIENYSGVVLNSVYRLVTPKVVWRDDFHWRDETYDEYCKRLGWAQYLWYCINLDKKTMLEHIRGVGYSGLRYDVS
jgi:MoaA/NifB/PqqE/SkfB family radical SAM enzyme